MSRLAFKSAVYHGYLRLGELDAVPANGDSFQFPNNEIRIHHISPISERCHPLSILQTVSSFSVRCKLEPSSAVEQANLISLHDSCLQEFKVSVRDESSDFNCSKVALCPFSLTVECLSCGTECLVIMIRSCIVSAACSVSVGFRECVSERSDG
ncbi:RNA polymerase II C-terminal domain phosphatase-like 2 isoform X1 [Syzygium oleosum]|uniref:RNA polymerase II C-terminal domain phosphatase-like 2 isoform X1 n=1 Tax=Syzygium oleosum TaxID=219896 RepID=UPI0024B90E49|nr:RNA polymerase II C-terminal domain phosphatase-like 2 isoform X1 [Syzygium oleosum]